MSDYVNPLRVLCEASSEHAAAFIAAAEFMEQEFGESDESAALRLRAVRILNAVDDLGS